MVAEFRTWHRRASARQVFGAAVLVAAGAVAVIAADRALALPGAVLGVSTGEPLSTRAMASRLADRSLMLDITRAGDRLVAVGERGRVLLSDDGGKRWRQSAGVPVSVTLTAVTFVDAKRGWATGHAGVVLHTVDGGESWVVQLDGRRAAELALKAAVSRNDAPAIKAARQLVNDGPDKPFLALEFTSPTQGIVAGAYGLLFSTDDGGATWASRVADADNPGSLHLNAVRTIAGATWIAGEKGLILRSDGGGRFAAVKSPYDGSWFAVDAMPNGAGVLVAGLRGHAYSSADDGSSWQQLAVPGQVTLSRTAAMAHHRMLLVDQSGAVLALEPGRLDAVLPTPKLPPTPPLTALAQASDGTIVATTLRGPVRLSLEGQP